jgi:hypothetical protein
MIFAEEGWSQFPVLPKTSRPANVNPHHITARFLLSLKPACRNKPPAELVPAKQQIFETTPPFIDSDQVNDQTDYQMQLGRLQTPQMPIDLLDYEYILEEGMPSIH